MSDKVDGHLTIALSAAVPLNIMMLQERGGPNQEDWEYLSGFGDVLGEPENAEALLFKSKHKGLTAIMFNELARVIAIMSYIPGGITIFGQHYETIKGAENG
jgi:hypothetical protein